jgi:hypothetical protein
MLRIPAFLLLSSLLVLAGCKDERIEGSGKIVTESRPVGKFTAVSLSGIGRLLIERGEAESLTVTVDDNLVPLFTSEVRDGTLHLSVARGKSPANEAVYKVTVSDLRHVELSGAGSVEAAGLDGETLSLAVSGAGSAKVAGRADFVRLTVSGAGDIDAAALTVKRAKVEVSGAGDAIVNASDELDARISGAGGISYLGAPKVTSQVSGAGSIAAARK